jgi:hypothetical protein
MSELTKYFPADILDGAWDKGGEYVFEVVTHPDGVSAFRVRGTTLEADSHLQFVAEHRGTTDATIVAMQVKSLHDYMRQGPVIIKPSNELCDALKDTEIRVPVSDYRMPFNVMGVELPPSVVGDFFPCLTMVWKFKPNGLIVWTMPKDMVTYHGRYGDDMPIEERLTQEENVDNDSDRCLMVTGSRIALNLCMLAGEYQTTTTPLPQRVRRHRQVKDPRLNRLAARHAQEVVVRDLVISRPDIRKDDGAGGGGAQQVSQHRRGHWKRQPYGPRHTLRKYMWIHPYFTHKDQRGDRPPTVILE